MTDQSKVEKSVGMAWPFASPQAAESMQVQIQALLKEQADLLDESRKSMTAWMRRRQEMMEAGFRTFQAMCACKDPAAFTAVYGEWLTSNINGILDEMNNACNEALRMAEFVQNSATPLFRQNADAPTTATTAVSSFPSGTATGRTKSAPRTEAAHHRSAAE
jgi:hypothetical protein